VRTFSKRFCETVCKGNTYLSWPMQPSLKESFHNAQVSRGCSERQFCKEILSGSRILRSECQTSPFPIVTQPCPQFHRLSLIDFGSFTLAKVVTKTVDNSDTRQLNRNDPVCVVPSKVAKASTVVTVTCHYRWNYHAKTSPM
jgi:hypothetical protein